ncbi:MAG: cohesin domain-containing protein [Oscillospiraceae bacterium]|nr:cohesin domain-containing protein [Oscillospiraceae bacterium]
MKRLFSLLLSAVMVLTLASPVVAAVSNPAFDVRITTTPETVNSKAALTVDWLITAKETGLQLRGSSGLRLAYDNTVLQLMRFNGTGADYTLTETLTGMPSASRMGVYEDAILDVRACQSSDGAIGYVTIEIGHSEFTYDCIKDVEEILASIRFAFREGKSEVNLNSNSIRLMSIVEMENKVQPAAVNISVASGTANIEYVYSSRTVADTLNAPEFDLPIDKPPDDPVDPDALTFTVSNVTARAGQNIEVPIVITNNDNRLSAVTMTVTFDSASLEWQDLGPYDFWEPNTQPWELGDLLPFNGDAPPGSIGANSVTFVFMNMMGTNKVDGTLITLKLHVKDDAPVGDTDITLVFASVGDARGALNSTQYNNEPGKVTVIDILYGDVNGDGDIDVFDSQYLARYLAGWPGYEDITMSADVNGDGVIDVFDSQYLARHLAGWPGYEILGSR